MLSQLIIAAIITGFSASNSGGMVVVAALGGANTFVAGVLALIRGTGNPERQQRNQGEMKKVVVFIEQKSRELQVTPDLQVARGFIQEAFKVYGEAWDIIEQNRPNYFTTTST